MLGDKALALFTPPAGRCSLAGPERGERGERGASGGGHPRMCVSEGGRCVPVGKRVPAMHSKVSLGCAPPAAAAAAASADAAAAPAAPVCAAALATA
eukprot:2808276-Rhodomonas_salina.1